MLNSGNFNYAFTYLLTNYRIGHSRRSIKLVQANISSFLRERQKNLKIRLSRLRRPKSRSYWKSFHNIFSRVFTRVFLPFSKKKNTDWNMFSKGKYFCSVKLDKNSSAQCPIEMNLKKGRDNVKITYIIFSFHWITRQWESRF